MLSGPALASLLPLPVALPIAGAVAAPLLARLVHRRLAVIAGLVALGGAQLEEPVLDAQTVEPVGQEADGLVVGEVGLPHPALGLRAPHPPGPWS